MPYRQPGIPATDRPDPARLIDACVRPLAILDRRLHVEHANPAFRALFDVEPSAEGSLHIADQAAAFKSDDALLAGLEAAADRGEPVIEHPLRLADGHPRAREVRVCARRIEGNGPEQGRLLVEAMAQGRSPSAGFEDDERRVLDIAMEEQRRLAGELEDNMLQSIAGIRLLIDAIRDAAASGTLDERLVGRLSHAVAEAGRLTTHIAGDVIGTVREGEFVLNAGKMALRLGGYYDTVIEFDDHSERQPCDAWIEANLLRVVRAATLAAIRDAGAVRISIGDDGAVFTVRIISSAAHPGRQEPAARRMDAAIMACHAELCGAALSIERGRRAGTTTVVSVPLGSRHAA